jgi:hypothetical protein
MKLDQPNDPIVHSDGWIVDPTLTGNSGGSQMRNVQRSSRIGMLMCQCIASDVGSIDVGTTSLVRVNDLGRMMGSLCGGGILTHVATWVVWLTGVSLSLNAVSG